MSSTLINDSGVATLKKVNDLKTLNSMTIPVRAAPGAALGSIAMNAAGTQLLVRKLDGSVGTVAIGP